jgi:putative zinc finger protein
MVGDMSEAPARGRSNRHPDEVLMASYLDGSLGKPQREDFESHLSVCDSCRGAVVALRAMPSLPPEAVPREFLDAALSQRPRGSLPGASILPRFAAATALLLVVVLGWIWVRRHPEGGDAGFRMRGGEASRFHGLSPEAGTVVPAGRVRFQWQPVEGADRYSVALFGGDGAKIEEITVPADRRDLGWPADRPPLRPGTYLWKMQALALDRVLVESDPIPIQVVP